MAEIKEYKTDNQFILYVAETENFEIKIALRFDDGGLTEFMNLSDTAFIHYPIVQHTGLNLKTNDFGDWYLASKAKEEWTHFLNHYLDRPKMGGYKSFKM